MKRIIQAFVVAMVGLGVGALAYATSGQATPSTEVSPCLPGWHVNQDEMDRKPEVVTGGLKFTSDNLIHHATTTTVEALQHGTFSATPAPDQPSFFSVEVAGTDGGYATLRWNTTTNKWEMSTGGQFYENASAAALVDMPSSHKSHTVVSFGVGYTKNPPGTVATTVKSVTFGGTTYSLVCAPSSSASASASTSASHGPNNPAPTPTASGSGAPSLPVTGPPIGLLVAGGVAVVVIGGVLILRGRRNKVQFRA